MAEWRVSFSGGERIIRAGSRWHQRLTDSTWEVVEPTGTRSYSPSGLGGCLDFWCRPVGELRDAQAIGWIRDYARPDGCVEFCGDSIAAGLIDADVWPVSLYTATQVEEIRRAAILAERERFRAMFDEALADHGITWPGEVDILYEKMFPAAAIREGVK